MGEFVCGILSVEDAREYDEYSAHGAKVMRDLVEAGRLPEAESVQDFISVTRRYVSQLRAQADAAAARGETTFVGRFPLSAGEYRMLKEMGGSLSTVVEIMTDPRQPRPDPTRLGPYLRRGDCRRALRRGLTPAPRLSWETGHGQERRWVGPE